MRQSSNEKMATLRVAVLISGKFHTVQSFEQFHETTLAPLGY